MSTYSYTIILDDSEAIMLKAALELMIQHCDEKMPNGPKAPFWAHKHSAEKVLARMFDNTMQISGNNFFNDYG